MDDRVRDRSLRPFYRSQPSRNIPLIGDFDGATNVTHSSIHLLIYPLHEGPQPDRLDERDAGEKRSDQVAADRAAV